MFDSGVKSTLRVHSLHAVPDRSFAGIVSDEGDRDFPEYLRDERKKN